MDCILLDLHIEAQRNLLIKWGSNLSMVDGTVWLYDTFLIEEIHWSTKELIGAHFKPIKHNKSKDWILLKVDECHLNKQDK